MTVGDCPKENNKRRKLAKQQGEEVVSSAAGVGGWCGRVAGQGSGWGEGGSWS